MPPDLIAFIIQYSYWGIFIGCLIEGEALVVIASFFAYQGSMYLPYVILIAFLGTLLSDIGWFLLGRHSNDRFLERWQWLRAISDHSITFVGKRPRLLAFIFRFMYGFRIIIPFSLGKTRISFSTFLVYNALGVLVWVGVFAGIGYFFASAVEIFFGRVKHVELIVALVILVAFVGFTYGHKIAERLLARYTKR